jgi:proteic killer suppression protein
MIISFGNKQTRQIWEGELVTAWPLQLQEIARRKLILIDSAIHLSDLIIPPSNRLERLKGKLKDYYSIRINSQWRIVFQWIDNHAFEVQIVDYH